MLRLIRRAIMPATRKATTSAAITIAESVKVDRRASEEIAAASSTALSARSFSMARYMSNVPVAAVNQLSGVMPCAASCCGEAPEAMAVAIASKDGDAPLRFFSLAASSLSRCTSSGVPPEVYSPMAMFSRYLYEANAVSCFLCSLPPCGDAGSISRWVPMERVSDSAALASETA